MAYELKINDAELAKSAVTYRKELLTMPVIAAQATLQHMSARPGVAGREVVGELSGDIELAPYNATRVDDKDVAVKSRTLETFLGSVIKRFDPNSAAKTVYGSLITQGEALAAQDGDDTTANAGEASEATADTTIGNVREAYERLRGIL